MIGTNRKFGAFTYFFVPAHKHRLLNCFVMSVLELIVPFFLHWPMASCFLFYFLSFPFIQFQVNNNKIFLPFDRNSRETFWNVWKKNLFLVHCFRNRKIMWNFSLIFFHFNQEKRSIELIFDHIWSNNWLKCKNHVYLIELKFICLS